MMATLLSGPEPDRVIVEYLKNHIQAKSPEISGVRFVRSVTLKTLLQDAWDSIPSEELLSLICSMHERCEAGIKANGGYTKC